MHAWFFAVAYLLLFLLILHLAMTFIPMMLNHNTNREKTYTRSNWRCYLQRIAGLLIITLIHPHLKAFVKEMPEPGILGLAFAAPGMELVSLVGILQLLVRLLWQEYQDYFETVLLNHALVFIRTFT